MYQEMKKCPDCGKLSWMKLHIDTAGTPGFECKSCGAIHEDRSWYLYVSSEEADEIIENREPLGLFVLDAGDVVVGIDNWSGDAWTEDFHDLCECLKWLVDFDKED